MDNRKRWHNWQEKKGKRKKTKEGVSELLVNKTEKKKTKTAKK
jgi:hypothetical protein